MLKRNSLSSEIRNELETMQKTKKKAELEILQEQDITYISDSYLPLKISEADWI